MRFLKCADLRIVSLVPSQNIGAQCLLKSDCSGLEAIGQWLVKFFDPDAFDYIDITAYPFGKFGKRSNIFTIVPPTDPA